MTLPFTFFIPLSFLYCLSSFKPWANQIEKQRSFTPCLGSCLLHLLHFSFHIFQRMRGRVKFDTTYEVRGLSNLGPSTVVPLYCAFLTGHLSTTVALILFYFQFPSLENEHFLRRRFNESCVSCGIDQRIKRPLSFVGNIVNILGLSL